MFIIATIIFSQRAQNTSDAPLPKDRASSLLRVHRVLTICVCFILLSLTDLRDFLHPPFAILPFFPLAPTLLAQSCENTRFGNAVRSSGPS